MDQTLTAEDESKDLYFEKVGTIAEEMIAAHGKDFAMGVLVLAARWIAEGKLGQEKAGGVRPGSRPS
ncbi:hypothetical protein DLJ53_07460 [Acuticoccus sediminis]|uniref:Uncharacterized protein n=1 Tax=Acuticoccus sediminis TaxID=2184697 RepID=A0A8B2NZM1_9HYPH|nr:hypothetical protein [Acuticoccus sediminis]RAI04271.1 hypothetical protein DLJ53_07460 [Acuticoccus sediminis]